MIECKQFEEFSFVGSHKAIGLQHGEQLKEKIEAAIEYYTALFNLPEKELFNQARVFRDSVAGFNQCYCEEIEAIAKSASVEQSISMR